MADEAKLLATFLHISDLHIGIADAVNDAQVRRVWEALSWFDGLLGHEYLALTHLESFFNDLRRRESARLIVTGDLTRVGADAEFAMVEAFLGSKLTFADGRSVGLRDPRWKELCVLGNHDQWPGASTIFGEATPAAQQLRSGMEPVTEVPVGGGYTLTFAKLDTDAQVGPLSASRLLARGQFVHAVKTLDDYFAMRPKQKHEIRILLMHHSISHRGVILGIGERSRTALERLIVRHGFALALNGHTHEMKSSPLSVTRLGTPQNLLEATCGTSTQRMIAPVEWRREIHRTTPNIVLVHRLVAGVRGLSWIVTPYRQTAQGFQPWREQQAIGNL